MWNPQVAVLSAPASPRKSGATVRRTHGMRPHDRHSLSGVHAVQLSSGRVRHETRTKSTDDRDDHPESKGPAHRRIFKPLPGGVPRLGEFPKSWKTRYQIAQLL